MELPNEVRKLDVSDMPELAEALDIEWSSRSYDGAPTRDPTRTFELGTHGALQLTLANGDVLVIGTSEWCTVDYYSADVTPNNEREPRHD